MRRLTETRVHGGIAGERVIFRSRLHKCPYSPAHADGRPVYGRPAAGRQRLNHGAAGDVTTADRLTGVDFSGDLHRGYWNAGRRSGSSARHRQRAGLSNAHRFGVQTPRYLLLVQRSRNKSLCRGVGTKAIFVQRSTEKPVFILACTTPKRQGLLCRRLRKMTFTDNRRVAASGHLPARPAPSPPPGIRQVMNVTGQ